MKEKLNAYRPAIAAFLTMMAMGLTSSTISFFLEPVCETLQVGRGSFSLFFSLTSITGAIANPFLGQYAGKKGVRGILLISGIWVCSCMFLLSLAHRIWIVHLAGFLMGLFSSTCVALCASVIVQQSYFGAQASGILGAVMAGSGVGGMIFSIVIPHIIQTSGWQSAMRIMGLLWLVHLWLATLLLGKQDMSGMGKNSSAAGLGMTRAEALRSPKLYLQMALIVIITACCGVQQQLPSLLGTHNYPAETVSIMISFSTAVLAVGKFSQGLLYGKIGIRKGGCMMLIAFAAGFLALLFKQLAYPGLILLSFGMGIYTTLLPQVARRTFGSREYASIWALITTVGSAGTFLANPVWGLIYDLSGSYTLGLLVCPVLLALGTAALIFTLKE